MFRTLPRIGLLVQRRNYSIDYIISSIPKKGPLDIPPIKTKKLAPHIQSKKKLKQKKTLAKEKKKEQEYEDSLVDAMLDEGFTPYTSAQTSKAQHFFRKHSQPTLSWTLADYDEIPDVKYERLAKEREEKYSNIDPFLVNETTRNMLNSKKTFGITPDLLQPLPEILLIGHTNAGKSTLINRLMIEKEKVKRQNQVAYVSARAGYTKTLNCFTVADKFRILDSPGFGSHSAANQGKIVIDYISKRSVLKMTYFVLDTRKEIADEDIVILEHLMENDVPFSIVFTKVKNRQVVKRLIEKLGLPCRKFIADDKGNKNIRASILEATGLL